MYMQILLTAGSGLLMTGSLWAYILASIPANYNISPANSHNEIRKKCRWHTCALKLNKTNYWRLYWQVWFTPLADERGLCR